MCAASNTHDDIATSCRANMFAALPHHPPITHPNPPKFSNKAQNTRSPRCELYFDDAKATSRHTKWVYVCNVM